MRRSLTLCILALVLAACGETPIQPEALDVPAPALAKTGPAGNGVEFFTSPFTGITHSDPDGDLCQVRNLETGEDDSSDWQRVDKKGNPYLHIQDAVATLQIILASGESFSGEGRWSVNWHFGMKGADVSTATGTVSDGVDSFQARCLFRRNTSGQLNNSIDVF